ncbi:hypothetical protein [Zhengella mangrovi]|uniref:hypothetical protein n=1 Tax=Zhengella mangrovi TaxID=1982044 RepID=UPI0013FDA405|nr:hypothetical protein [Zhengella mangrovi]
MMVPGGFVETRSFPGYGVAVLGAFNIFLTLLGLGSLVLAWRAFRAHPVGKWAVLAGVAFVAVYGLDLAHIFPVAAEPMTGLLAAMEWIGTVLGLALIAAGYPLKHQQSRQPVQTSPLPRWLFIAMAAVGVAIIVFATQSVT